MVHTNVRDTTIRGPYEDTRKNKNEHASSGHQQQSQQRTQQQAPSKNDKYGSWGPVYKNKQNFIDMHIC